MIILHTFDPTFVLPDTKTFMQQYLPESYESERTRIANAMKCGLKYFPLTTDGWTSRANHNYIAHYIGDKWNLQSHLLDTGEMSMDHTAMNLADKLQDSLTDKLITNYTFNIIYNYYIRTTYVSYINSVYVTRFAKRGLIHAQIQDTLFIYSHLIATSMDQQHVCLILLKVEQSAFTQTSFSSLSDVHECSSGLTSTSARMAFKWLHLHLTSRQQPTVIHHTTGW